MIVVHVYNMLLLFLYVDFFGLIFVFMLLCLCIVPGIGLA